MTRIRLCLTTFSLLILFLSSLIPPSRAVADPPSDSPSRADSEDDYRYAQSSLKRGNYQVALDSVNRALIAFPGDKKYVDLKTSILENARTNGVKLLDRIATSCGDEPQTSPNHTPGTLKTVTIAGIDTRFRWCPLGEFMMGSPRGELGRERDENQRCVFITHGFWLAETETTQLLWRAVMGSNPSETKGDLFPVQNVDWNDCQNFVNAIKRYAPEGMTFTLPSEEHWEYACRAGTTTVYSFGDNLDVSQANMNAKKPKPVRSYHPNNWGLYDMHGNVSEWCKDTCIDDVATQKDVVTGGMTSSTLLPASRNEQINAFYAGAARSQRILDAAERKRRALRPGVLRGGNRSGDAKGSRSAARLSAAYFMSEYWIGFRLELTDVLAETNKSTSP